MDDTNSDTILNLVRKALVKNNMETYIAKDRDEAKKIVFSMIDKSDVVGAGGSVTLDECGIRQKLRDEGYDFLDRFVKVTPEEKEKIFHETLSCDVFLTSSNSITHDGKLFNVDGRGNRMAAVIFGPKKVIVVAGKNKIVKDLLEARERMDTISAPLNAKRLGKKTPCATIGHCVDCESPDRICRHTVITERQAPGRISVVLVDEELGI